MAAQHLNSSDLSARQDIAVNSYTTQCLLRAFRWALTTSWFLFLLAAILIGVSLLASFYTDAWHWFQRSGALMVSIGAVLSTRRALQLILEGMIGDGKPTRPLTTRETIQAREMGELQTCVCGFMFVAMGTLIWAYGDLLGCLMHWNSVCLA
jgi:hypothetical protein